MTFKDKIFRLSEMIYIFMEHIKIDVNSLCNWSKIQLQNKPENYKQPKKHITQMHVEREIR